MILDKIGKTTTPNGLVAVVMMLGFAYKKIGDWVGVFGKNFEICEPYFDDTKHLKDRELLDQLTETLSRIYALKYEIKDEGVLRVFSLAESDKEFFLKLNRPASRKLEMEKLRDGVAEVVQAQQGKPGDQDIQKIEKTIREGVLVPLYSLMSVSVIGKGGVFSIFEDNQQFREKGSVDLTQILKGIGKLSSLCDMSDTKKCLFLFAALVAEGMLSKTLQKLLEGFAKGAGKSIDQSDHEQYQKRIKSAIKEVAPLDLIKVKVTIPLGFELSGFLV